MLNTEIRQSIVVDAKRLGLEVISEGGAEDFRGEIFSSSTLIQGSEADLRRIAAGNGLDIQSNCPCPLDVWHGSKNPRKSTRVGGTRDAWDGEIWAAKGLTYLSLNKS